MEWQMLWKDLAIGFLIGGLLAALVPDSVWKTLFLTDAPAWVRGPVDVVLGPIIAVLTFVCSIGNLPLAAVLWAGGASFSGVLAFLYADLIVLPLLDVYRRYFGWRMAAYIGGVFFVTMALAGLVVDLAFTGLGWIPSRALDVRAEMTTFSLNYTFWLNLLFGALAAYLYWVNHQNPMVHSHHRHGQDHADPAGHCDHVHADHQPQ